MTHENATPRDFGLKVRCHPAGLEITSANKMRTGEDVEVHFGDTLIETTAFYRGHTGNPAGLVLNRRNRDWGQKLLSSLGNPIMRPGSDGSNFVWKGAHGTDVVDFLMGYESHPASRSRLADALSEYIREQMKVGELTEWYLALMNVSANSTDLGTAFNFANNIAGYGSIRGAGDDERNYFLSKSHLISPSDESLDLTVEERRRALELTAQYARIKAEAKRGAVKADPKIPSGKAARAVRPAKRGLLLLYMAVPPKDVRKEGEEPCLGYAVSLPVSISGKTISYRFNNVALYEDDYLE